MTPATRLSMVRGLGVGRPVGHGTQNLSQAVQNSCNPAFMDMALSLGREKFYDYIEAFGFGKKTGIDISGEEKGVLMPEASVKNVDLARMGFGQSISVTPLQLINWDISCYKWRKTNATPPGKGPGI